MLFIKYFICTSIIINLYKVKVKPSNEPVFLKAQENQKEFWVRANASNRQITEIDKILSYWANLKREDSNE